MIIKNLLAPNKRSFWTAIIWTLLILYFSFKSPSGEQRFYFPNADKVVHFTFYLVFVVLWFRFFLFKKHLDFKVKAGLFITAVLLGIAVELGQDFLTTTRQADVWDAVANTMGSAVGILVSIYLFESKEK